ncbi:cation diffusion facilitator family transporter [Faecalispora anaeroviscerum]|uniref:cation diffusion facilitator family transporter n=1 Tax=Faecalispora anaeroviscerum TaxID=2991836 RepID=UPI0024BA87D0|nr:cation diffusion facilitator family transporter [Faecalispora anaeroviscerum]
MFENWGKTLLTNEKKSPEKRSKLIRLASASGIIANIIFAGVKLVVGTIANSVSILSDAVNNLSDALSSVITLAGLKLSERPPDRKHPLGYGRIEYVSGLIVSVIVLMTGIEFLKTSAQRILQPQDVYFTAAQLIVLSITILGKWLLSRFHIAAGKAADSDSLIASGTDAKMDVIASVVTVVAAVVAKLTGWHVDGYVGALLSLFILYTGIGLIRDTLSSIIGERPEKELAENIKAEVLKYEPIMGAYDLILHNYGPVNSLGSLNVEIPDTVTVEKAYETMTAAQKDVLHKFGIYFTFGLYSVNTYDQEIVAMREHVRQIILSVPGAISLHAFNYDKDNHMIRFDIVVDFSVHNFSEFRKQVTKELLRHDPSAQIQMNIDLDYA